MPPRTPTPAHLAAVEFASAYFAEIKKRFGGNLYDQFNRQFCEMALSSFPEKHPKICTKLVKHSRQFRADARIVLPRILKNKYPPHREHLHIAALLVEGKTKEKRGASKKTPRDFLLTYLMYILHVKFSLIEPGTYSAVRGSPEAAVIDAISALDKEFSLALLNGSSDIDQLLGQVTSLSGWTAKNLVAMMARDPNLANITPKEAVDDILYAYFLVFLAIEATS